jgi:hypothetical protein
VALDELNEIQKQVIVKSTKTEVTGNSDSSFTDSGVSSEDIMEEVNSDPVDKPPNNNYYNNF